MISLSEKWIRKLAAEPEAGMGYQIVSLVLNDGRHFDPVLVIEGRIAQISGRTDIPFTEEQVVELKVTNDKDQARRAGWIK